MTIKTRNLLILIGILILSLSLHIVKIGQEGFGNNYYAAAAKNMLSSPSNFFFGSFDSQGFVTVDKPPVGLWIQSLFILIFGFNTFSIMLPSIIAGTLSVFLLYLIVRKTFGETAGLSAAFILAITPVFVALSRNNTMDAMLITVLLFATWLFQKGLESRKIRHFLFCSVFIGIAFNIKMMQAFVILPALLTVFLIYYKPRLSKKVLHTLLVSVILIAVSLSWAFIVELTPENQRPYIGGSESNSALELMIQYNGLDRAAGGQNFYFETGTPGFFRLFNPFIGGQIGWFILFAVLGSLLYLGYALKEKSLLSNEKRDLLYWGIWFLVLYSYLSFNTGFFHTHYIAMLSPAVAAMGGIAVIGCLKALQSRTFLKWFPPGILALSILSQLLLGRTFSDWNRPMTIAMIVLSAVSSGVILFSLFIKKWENVVRPVLFGELLALAILPFSWSLTPILYGGDPVIPYARPDLKEMKIGEAYFQIINRDESVFDKLLAFLEENRNGEEYLLGVKSALADGSNLMLLTDGDIMSLGGFSGTDPVLSSEEIAALAADGTIRFFLMTPTGDSNEAIDWVKRHGKIILNSEWRQNDEFIGSILYDCRPKTNN